MKCNSCEYIDHRKDGSHWCSLNGGLQMAASRLDVDRPCPRLDAALRKSKGRQGQIGRAMTTAPVARVEEPKPTQPTPVVEQHDPDESKPTQAERRGWDEQQVIDLHNQGMNPSRILKTLGRPQSSWYTVSAILKRHGLEPHYGRPIKGKTAAEPQTAAPESVEAPSLCPVAENPECVEETPTTTPAAQETMANPNPRQMPSPEERVAGCMEWLNGVKREIDTAHGLLQQFHEAYGFSAEAAQLADTLRIVTENRLAALGVA